MRAPHVHAVRPNVDHVKPAEPHVAGAVEDRDGDTRPATRPAPVEREVGDDDSSALRDQQGPVPLSTRRADHGPWTGAEEACGVSDLDVVQPIASGPEPDGDPTMAKGRQRPAEPSAR